jgi:hypothetical protein
MKKKTEVSPPPIVVGTCFRCGGDLLQRELATICTVACRTCEVFYTKRKV